MAQFERTEGIFIGKMLVGDGQKKDGSWYRKYKLQFKPNETSQKSFSMSLFQKSLPPEYKSPEPPQQWTTLPELVEGQWYIIDYTVTDGTYQGSPIKYKTVWKIGAGRIPPEEKNAPVQPQQQTLSQPQAPQRPLPCVAEFSNFSAEYDQNMQGKEQWKTTAHMVGLWIMNNRGEEFKQIIENCRAHCQKK